LFCLHWFVLCLSLDSPVVSALLAYKHSIGWPVCAFWPRQRALSCHQKSEYVCHLEISTTSMATTSSRKTFSLLNNGTAAELMMIIALVVRVSPEERAR